MLTVAVYAQKHTNHVYLFPAAVSQATAGVRMPQIQPATTWTATGRAAAAWQLVRTAVKPAASAVSGWDGQDTAGSNTQHWWEQMAGQQRTGAARNCTVQLAARLHQPVYGL
jgi:hypothetical protein